MIELRPLSFTPIPLHCSSFLSSIPIPPPSSSLSFPMRGAATANNAARAFAFSFLRRRRRLRFWLYVESSDQTDYSHVASAPQTPRILEPFVIPADDADAGHPGDQQETYEAGRGKVHFLQSPLHKKRTPPPPSCCCRCTQTERGGL